MKLDNWDKVEALKKEIDNQTERIEAIQFLRNLITRMDKFHFPLKILLTR